VDEKERAMDKINAVEKGRKNDNPVNKIPIVKKT
jgi:hypothetical protein